MTVIDQPVAYRKLTLVCPADLAERVVDILLEADVEMTGFTTFKADGHGHDFASASIGERVRGRVARRVIVAVLKADDVAALLGDIQKQIDNPDLSYWTEPVLAYGHLS
jgi:hypothetical protein